MQIRGHTHGNTVVDLKADTKSKGGEVANARGHGHIVGAGSEAKRHFTRHAEVDGH